MDESNYGYSVLAFSYLMTHAATAANLLAIMDQPITLGTKIVLPCISHYPMVIRANPYFRIRRETDPLGCEATVTISSRGIKPPIAMTAEVSYNEPDRSTFVEFKGVPTNAILAAAKADPEPAFDLKVISNYLTVESAYDLNLSPLVLKQFGTIGRFVYRPAFTKGDSWQFRGEFQPESRSLVSPGLLHFLTSTLARAWASINL